MSRTLEDVLLLHAAHYPEMEPRDAVKLVYQSFRGPGHLISDRDGAYARVAEELSKSSPRDCELFEDIGNGLARLALASPTAHALGAELIAAMFFESAKRDVTAPLDAGLEMLHRVTRDGGMPFSEETLESFLSSYIADGAPAISHSEAYRARYAPAYRVVDARYARLVPVMLQICRRLSERGHARVALEGPAAAGKSTAAALLAPLFGAGIIHTDDFFLPPALRTPQRLDEPGGNLHYERFISQVLPRLNAGAAFSYDVFDCSVMSLSGKRSVSGGAVTVVEGVYSTHPRFGDPYDLTVFIGIDPDEQAARVRLRGDERFFTQWIPMENKYFSYYGIRKKCDMRI